MKIILTALLLLVAVCIAAQPVNIGSKSFTASSGVTKKDTSVDFKAAGYADYPVKVTKDGVYNFTVRMINYSPKAAALYIWSSAAGKWSSATAAINKSYQLVSEKVNMNAATTLFRLYTSDSTTVDNISYEYDALASLTIIDVMDRLKIAEQKITSLQAQLDSMPQLYIVPGYGVKNNPIKP